MSRLDKLMRLLEAEPGDAFVLYGVAQEHANAARHAEAVGYFDRCLGADVDYLYAYYHKAVSQQELGDVPGARATLRAGLAAARKAADVKAMGEMQALQDSLD